MVSLSKSSSCDGEKVPAPQKNAFFSFVKSIASFKGDLASITAPPFLLSPQSMTEFSAYWAEHPSLFVAPAHIESPVERSLAVLKWFISTLSRQHNNKDENGNRRKLKPLNPFLGEIFLGSWEDENGWTELVSEQVSHHPPATAFKVWNEQHGVRVEGHIAPKSYFSGTVHIERRGYGLYHIDKYNEDHVCTMPKVHVEGLMSGSLAPELSGTSYIRSSSGYFTKIEYHYKGWIRGTRHSFVATICHEEKKDEPIYVVEGLWNGTYTVKDGKTEEIIETVDTTSHPRPPLKLAPLESQDSLESRRAWKPVSDAINNGDITTVGREKSKIENEQREMRRQEKSQGTEWSRRYFTFAKEDPVASKLAEGTPMRIGEDDQMIWLWNEEGYQQSLRCSREGSKNSSHTRLDSGVSMDMTSTSASSSS